MSKKTVHLIELDSTDSREALSKLRTYIQAGNQKGISLGLEVEEKFRCYAETMGYVGKIAWGGPELRLSGPATDIKIKLSKLARRVSKIYIREYIVLRPFYCWLSSLMALEEGQTQHAIFLRDTDLEFAFRWKLSDEENEYLQRIWQVDGHELAVSFDLFARVVPFAVNLVDGNVLSEGRLLANHNYKEGVIIMTVASRKLGLMLTAFYCSLIDRFHSGEGPL